MKPRATVVILLFTSLIVILFFSLFQLQIINGAFYDQKAQNLNVRFNYFQPERGIITDRNGIPLVQNVIKYDMYLVKGDYSEEYVANLKTQVTESLGITDVDLSTSLEKVSREDSKLLTNLDSNQASALKDKLKDDSGVYFASGFKRQYTYPYEFSHILGYTGIANEQDLENGYDLNDQLGKYKLEADLENDLKGIKGKVTKVGGVVEEQSGEPGKNVTLTIDSVWQRGLYRVLRDYIEAYDAPGGAGIVIDNSNGEVMAMASYPGFDSNNISSGLDPQYYQSLLDDAKKPLSDKAIGAQATPGSIFKLITAYTLLENGVITADSTYFSDRCIYFSDAEFCEFSKLFYGEMDLERAIYKSSNVYFCNYMMTLEQQYGIGKFVETANQFNIGGLTGIDLSGEVKGNMDSPEYKRNTFDVGWFAGDTCNAAIGQGSIVTTPIQMAMVPSVIQNSGVYYKPHIVQSVSDFDGANQKDTNIEIQKTLPLSLESREVLLSGMYGTAHNPESFVFSFLNDVPVNLRIKTGTAETFEVINGVLYPRTNSWIIGLFDYNGKSYSFVFFSIFGPGSYYAAPYLGNFLACLNAEFPAECL